MRSADALVTVTAVAREHSAEAEDPPRRPRASAERPWLATAVFAASTALVALALVDGSAPHARGRHLFLAFVAYGPIALLRRWPLPVLAAATLVNALVMAEGNAALPFGIVLGLASYLAASQLRSGNEPPRPNAPAGRSSRSGCASPANCTTS